MLPSFFCIYILILPLFRSILFPLFTFIFYFPFFCSVPFTTFFFFIIQHRSIPIFHIPFIPLFGTAPFSIPIYSIKRDHSIPDFHCSGPFHFRFPFIIIVRDDSVPVSHFFSLFGILPFPYPIYPLFGTAPLSISNNFIVRDRSFPHFHCSGPSHSRFPLFGTVPFSFPVYFHC